MEMKEHGERHRRLIRSTVSVAVPTVFSRILGYVRDMLQAYFLGTGLGADAFTIAYIIPNLLRRLTGEGAMSAALVPVLADMKKDKPEKDVLKLISVFFMDAALITAALAAVGMVFAPGLVKILAFGFKNVQGKLDLTTSLTRLMFPYLFLVSLAALASAVLNSYKKFFVPALPPVFFNVAIIAAAVIFARRSKEPAMVFAVGVLAGGVLQILCQVPLLKKEGVSLRAGPSFKHPAVRRTAALMVPGLFGVGVSQINFAVSRAFASGLEEGSVSSLYYASRIQELTLGVFSIALSVALLPSFSELAAGGDLEGLKKTLRFSLRLIFFITFPAAAGLLILNKPIIQVLFQRGLFDARSTALSSTCLLFLAFGLPFISGVKILAPAFYSLKDTKTPVVIAFFVMLTYCGSSWLLMGPMRIGGIALALSLAEFVNFLLLAEVLRRRIGGFRFRDVLDSALRSGVSAVLMGGGVWLFLNSFAGKARSFIGKAGVLAGAIILGVGLYLAASAVLQPGVLKELKDLKKSDRNPRLT